MKRKTSHKRGERGVRTKPEGPSASFFSISSQRAALSRRAESLLGWGAKPSLGTPGIAAAQNGRGRPSRKLPRLEERALGREFKVGFLLPAWPLPPSRVLGKSFSEL